MSEPEELDPEDYDNETLMSGVERVMKRHYGRLRAIMDQRFDELVTLIKRTHPNGPGLKRPASVQLFFWPPGVPTMTQATMHVDDTSVTATLVITDKSGQPAAAASPPVWTLATAGVVTMTIAADGLSASFVPAGAGTTDIDVVVEGDPTPGVDTIHGTGTIVVLAAEAAKVDVNFGAVT